jgi:hypothetical protein
MIFRVFVAIAIVVLSACATMTENECSVADWQAIGYEDGANGHELSYLGNHRKACADYGVSPDFDRYKKGRLSGLKEYCVPATAFSAGRAGRQLNLSCAEALSPGFELAWSQGRELHRAESQLRSSENALNNHLLWLENLEVKIQRAEAALVSDGLNRHQRKQILSDLKQLGADMVDAEYDFLALENQMLDDQDFVREIRERYGY